jgi:hypothetical protein
MSALLPEADIVERDLNFQLCATTTRPQPRWPKLPPITEVTSGAVLYDSAHLAAQTGELKRPDATRDLFLGPFEGFHVVTGSQQIVIHTSLPPTPRAGNFGPAIRSHQRNISGSVDLPRALRPFVPYGYSKHDLVLSAGSRCVARARSSLRVAGERTKSASCCHGCCQRPRIDAYLE